MKPGIEIVMEANEEYWRKVPSVKRLVFLSVPEGTTRLAMLKGGEIDVAYLLEGQLGESIKNDPKLNLVFSGGVATFALDFFDMWDPKSPWADQRVRKAASLAFDRKMMSDTDNLGASKPNGSVVRKNMEFALRKKTARGGRVSKRVRCRRFLCGAAVFRDRRGDGRLSRRDRHQDEAAHDGTRRVLLGTGVEKAEGRLLLPRRGDLRQRLDPDVDDRAEHRRQRLWRLARYKKQLTETDPEKREAILHEIQKILHERTRFAPIWDYYWPSGIGPRVEEASLMKIDPYPWSAPLEDVKLKTP